MMTLHVQDAAEEEDEGYNNFYTTIEFCSNALHPPKK